MNLMGSRLGFMEIDHTTKHLHFPQKIVSKVYKETVFRNKKKEIKSKSQILYVDV